MARPTSDLESGVDDGNPCEEGLGDGNLPIERVTRSGIRPRGGRRPLRILPRESIRVGQRADARCLADGSRAPREPQRLAHK